MPSGGISAPANQEADSSRGDCTLFQNPAYELVPAPPSHQNAYSSHSVLSQDPVYEQIPGDQEAYSSQGDCILSRNPVYEQIPVPVND